MLCALHQNIDALQEQLLGFCYMPQFAFTICHLHQCPGLHLHIIGRCAVAHKGKDFPAEGERFAILAIGVRTVTQNPTSLTIKAAVFRRGDSMSRLCGNRFLGVIGSQPSAVGIRIDNGLGSMSAYRREQPGLLRTIHTLH